VAPRVSWLPAPTQLRYRTATTPTSRTVPPKATPPRVVASALGGSPTRRAACASCVAHPALLPSHTCHQTLVFRYSRTAERPVLFVPQPNPPHSPPHQYIPRVVVTGPHTYTPLPRYCSPSLFTRAPALFSFVWRHQHQQRLLVPGPPANLSGFLEVCWRLTAISTFLVVRVRWPCSAFCTLLPPSGRVWPEAAHAGLSRVAPYYRNFASTGAHSRINSGMIRLAPG
jgi:hypothetical protein